MNVLRILGTVCALGIGLSACVESPTAASAGGHTVGSGNLREARSRMPGSALDTRMAGEAASSSLHEALTMDGAVVRAGHTVGSGN